MEAAHTTNRPDGPARVIFCVVGTRPECVKMAPVITALRQQSWAQVRVISTGQHRELVAQTLGIFGITPDMDLDLMEADQTLAGLTARILTRLDPLLAAFQPDLVLAQGDTTTVMATGLASFYRQIPFGHVEAGLRTHDIRKPFPEELNRVMAGHLASIHFAPTAGAKEHLLRQGAPEATVHITGNTGIDALLQMASRPGPAPAYPRNPAARLVVLTAHRRENFGAPLRNICAAVTALHARFPDLEFVFPVHPNPNVRDVVQPLLSPLGRVHLIEPVDHLAMTGLLRRCHFIMTDSGGLQEEGPALGKPVLVLRSETERPEGVQAGMAILVGTDTAAIVTEASRLLEDTSHHARIAQVTSPYGDGQAAQRIALLCGALLGVGCA